MKKLERLEREELRLLIKIIDEGVKEEPDEDYYISLKEVRMSRKIMNDLYIGGK